MSMPLDEDCTSDEHTQFYREHVETEAETEVPDAGIIAALRKRVEELERDNVAAQVTVGAFEDIKARAEKAERELQRIEAKRIERQKKHARCDFKRRERMRQLQANLDAATFFADSLQARLDLHEAHDSACPCSGDGELHSYSCRDCTCGIGEEFREVLTRAEQAERERDDAKQYADEYKKAYLAELDGIKKHMDKSFDVAIRIIENWGGPTTTTKTMREIHARAEKAEQERDKLAEGYERRRQELDAQYAEIKKLQADLDAALDWIKGVGGPMGRGGYPTDRVLALLEKRREERRG